MKKTLHVLVMPVRFLKQRSMKVKIFLGILTVIIIVIVFRSLTRDTSPDYEIEAATLSTIEERVTETGNVSTSGITPIYSTTTGVVDEIFVENGQVVEDSQPLFSVKSTATKQQQDSALATYLSAKNSLDAAKKNQLSLQAQMFSEWDQFKELAESDEFEDSQGNPKYDQRGLAEFHVPEKEWLAAESAYKNQQQVINQASVNMSAAWEAYQATQDSEVISVLGGQVQNLSVTKGEQIIAGTYSATNSLSPVMYLINTTILPTIKVEVNETDALKIEVGQRAYVEFDAVSNMIFEATVTRVDSIASTTSDIVTFTAYVTIDQQNDLIRKGLTADVDIIVARKDNTLTVPTSSVKPYQGGRAVRVLDENEEIVFIPVTIGSNGDGKTEILSGIEEGQEVIVSLANDQVERRSRLFN